MIYGGRLSGIPAFFSNRKACKDTFGRYINWTIADRCVYDHISMACQDIGQALCTDSYAFIADATGLNRGTVIKAVNRLAELKIIHVAPDPVRSLRDVWLLSALRDDLRELSGIDRDDPDCTEPQRPAFTIHEPEPDDYRPLLDGCPVAQKQPARRVGATGHADGVGARPVAQKQPARRVGATGQSHTPGNGNEKPFAQPGSCPGVAPGVASATIQTPPEREQKLVSGGANVNVKNSLEELTLTSARGQMPGGGSPCPVDPGPDTVGRQVAEKVIKGLFDKGVYLYLDASSSGLVVRPYYTPAALRRLEPEHVEKLAPLAAELVEQLRALGRLGLPKGARVAEPEPAITAPLAASPPAPAAGASPGLESVRRIYGCKNLHFLEEATAMMIDLTRDDRARAGHTVSLRGQRKYARLCIAGELPWEDYEEGLGMVLTAGRPAAAYMDNMKKAEAAQKNRAAGASPKSPDRPEAMPTYPG